MFYARLAPSLDMIEMNKQNQGIFTSVEITPNFAKTGKAYLSGLAFTDSPASLCTEQLRFNKRIGDKFVQINEPQAVDLIFSLEADEEDRKQVNAFMRFFSKFLKNNKEDNATMEHLDKLIGG